MAKHHGQNIMSAFCEAVGLNPKMWRTVEIRMATDEAVTVRAWGFAEIEGERAEGLTELFKEFLLYHDGHPVGPTTKFIKEDE